MDEENSLEVIPLRSRLSLSSQKSTTRPLQSSYSDGNLDSNERSTLVRQAIASLMLHYIGWYFPRYMASFDHSIEGRDPPFQQTKAGDVILDPLLNDPLVYPPTVGSMALHCLGIYVPLAIVCLTVFSCYPRSRLLFHDLHAGCCGMLSAVGLSEGATVLLKTYVHRRRPNFYSLCIFDKTLLKCTGSVEQIREANFSFPSGHSSLVNCGMTFLVCFFLGKVLSNGSRHNRRVMGVVSCVVPWGCAFFVGASRLVDHWHHPSDVIAGLMLGGLSATVIYHAWYPPVWSPDAGCPLSLLSTHESSKLASCDE